MGSQTTYAAHLLLLSIPGWGSLRPLCAFATKAVRERSDIVITFMTCGSFEKRIEAECNRYISDEETTLKARIRLVNIGGEGFQIVNLIEVMFNVFPAYYARLAGCEFVQSKSTGEVFPATRRPTVVILNYNLYPIMQAVRSVTGKDVPVFAWHAGNACFYLRIFGPERFGGLGEVPEKAHGEVTDEMVNMMQGELVTLPGLPPFYDYEWYPQPEEFIKGLPATTSVVFKTGCKFMEECDGLIYTSSSAYEPESIEATRQWLAGSGNRGLYAIGPMVPSTMGIKPSNAAMLREMAVLENEDGFPEFMDNMLAKHGESSLIYMSFGSLWWPTGEHVRIFVEVLLELGIPFIFSVASPDADLPSELVTRVVASGIGIISKWSPQQMIFSHPVTGWVVTHGGHNTVIEALAQGKPLIAWPIVFDQPANAAYLTLKLDVAFELIHVRAGKNGLRPLYRGGQQPAGTLEAVAAEAKDVLERARGEEGARKRRNAEVMRAKLRETWEERGAGLGDFRRLLRDVTKPP